MENIWVIWKIFGDGMEDMEYDDMKDMEYDDMENIWIFGIPIILGYGR